MLDLALKEWRVVCELLAQGRTALLLRKGGVHEDGGPGRFKLEHDRFALFPATEHENFEWVKPAYREGFEPVAPQQSTVLIPGWAEVAKIWQIPSREAFDQLDDLYAWEKPQIDVRFHYKPDRPLYLMALRAYRLAEAKSVAVTQHYWGCKSWVDLSEQDQVAPVGELAMAASALDELIGRVDAAMI